MTILIIEDNHGLREALVCALDYAGYLVSTVSNGQEALKKLEVDPLPGVIFLDLMMPILDGYSFRETKKSMSRIRDIPTIIASAKTDLEKIKKMPGEFFLPKPFDLDELLNALTGIGNLKAKIRTANDH